MSKIALDAGHGMHTAGKRCMKSIDKNETREWWMNDRICDKIEKKLGAHDGYALIRVDDTTGNTDVSLGDRVRKANHWGADFYLSVHHNAGVGGGSGGGIVSIVYTKASETSNNYSKIIYDELIKETGLKGNRSTPLAKQNLYVCRETNMPSVLVECGFMDSTTDVPIIITEEFAERCADGFVNALVKIGNLKPLINIQNPEKTEIKEDLSMELYNELKKEIEALKSENKALKDIIGSVYKTVDEIPDYYKPTIKPLIDKGAIKGVGENNLNLPEIIARTLVIINRDKSV
jgi:N-acetylmuramoyl-L-alanine amidase